MKRMFIIILLPATVLACACSEHHTSDGNDSSADSADAVDSGTATHSDAGTETDTDADTDTDTDTHTDTDTDIDTDSGPESDTGTVPGTTDSETETESDSAAANCPGAQTIHCGDHIDGATTDDLSRWFGYACSAMAMTGPDSVYVFVPNADYDVEIKISNLSDSLSLILLDDCNTTEEFTNATECRTMPEGYLDDYSLTFTAQSGVTKYIVVDGYNDIYGSYTLQLVCTAK